MSFHHDLWRIFKRPSLSMNIFHKPFDTERPLQKQKGFTLVELLAVILNLGILAGVAITMLFGYRQRAHVKTVESDLSQANNTSLAYYVDNPDDQVDLVFCLKNNLNKS